MSCWPQAVQDDFHDILFGEVSDASLVGQFLSLIQPLFAPADQFGFRTHQGRILPKNNGGPVRRSRGYLLDEFRLQADLADSGYLAVDVVVAVNQSDIADFGADLDHG